MKRTALALLGTLLCAGAGAAAQDDADDAHGHLAEARAAFDAAHLEASLRAYDQALRAGLPRRTLVTLLGERAVVANALGEDDRAERDLRALLSLDPEGELADEAPPSLRRRLDALREDTAPLRLDVVATPTSEGWTVRVLVRGDDAALVQDTVVELEHDDGSTEELPTARRQVQVDEWTPVLRVRAFALGYGGHRLAESEPRTVERPGGSGPGPTGGGGLETPRDPRKLRRGLGIGGALFAILAISIGLSVRTPESGIRPSPPREVR